MKNTNLWIILVDRSRPISDVLRELAHAGLVVDHVLETMGGICGLAEERSFDRLRRVRGVTSVRPDTSLDTGRLAARTLVPS